PILRLSSSPLNTLQQLAPVPGKYTRLRKKPYIPSLIDHRKIPLIRFIKFFQYLVQVIIGSYCGVGGRHQLLYSNLVVQFAPEDRLPHIVEVDDPCQLPFIGNYRESVTSRLADRPDKISERGVRMNRQEVGLDQVAQVETAEQNLIAVLNGQLEFCR